MKAIVLLFLTLVLLASCGKAPTAEVRVTGSMAMTGTAFSGGAVLLATTIINDKVETFSIPMDYGEITYDFPIGRYNIMALGWDGINPMTGNLFCDAKESIDIQSDGDMKFLLTQVDSAATNVVDTLHPCKSFIDGDLVPLNYAKFCSEKNPSGTNVCSYTNNYIRNGNNLTIRYGLIGYQGPPIKSRPFWTEPKFTTSTSKCINTTDISNYTEGNNLDIAKVDFSTSVGSLKIPRRLLKGLRLPIAFGVYEDESNSTDCQGQFFEGAAVVGNSIGEKKSDGSDRHYVDSSFIFRIPTENYEYTPFNEISLTTTYNGADVTFEITNYGKKTIELVPNLTGITSFTNDGSILICAPSSNCYLTISPTDTTTDSGYFDVNITDEATGETIETERVNYQLTTI